jgi:hypothetical protein
MFRNRSTAPGLLLLAMLASSISVQAASLCDIRIDQSAAKELFRQRTTSDQRELYSAVEDNNESLVRANLTKRTDVNFRGPSNQWLISTAVQGSNPAIVKALLQSGADPVRTSCGGLPAIGFLGYPPNTKGITDDAAAVQIADDLTSSGASLVGKGNAEARAILLAQAATQGHLLLIEWLLAHGVGVDEQRGGSTALMAAITANQVSAAKRLLDSGASLLAGTTILPTPLLLAIDSGNPELVRLILEHGANPNVGCVYATPLSEALGNQHLASLNGRSQQQQLDEIVRLLRSAGATKLLEK